MIIIKLGMELKDTAKGWRSEYLFKTIEFPTVPREGENIQITEGGWSEPVHRVWWDASTDPATVQIELGMRAHIEYNSTVEDLADYAKEAGWK